MDAKLRSLPAPASPPPRDDGGWKSKTVLSPASPLDSGCWSPSASITPLKKLKQAEHLFSVALHPCWRRSWIDIPRLSTYMSLYLHFCSVL